MTCPSGTQQLIPHRHFRTDIPRSAPGQVNLRIEAGAGDTHVLHAGCLPMQEGAFTSHDYIPVGPKSDPRDLTAARFRANDALLHRT